MTDSERIAAFLASKGATQVAPAPAYGVDPATDKERRRAAYRAASDHAWHMTEQEAEQRQQRGVEENGYYKS